MIISKFSNDAEKRGDFPLSEGRFLRHYYITFTLLHYVITFYIAPNSFLVRSLLCLKLELGAT